MTNPHAEWLRKLADGIRDVLSPSEYQRMKFCAEMLETLDGRPSEPNAAPPHCPTCLCGIGHCPKHPAAIFHPPAACPECASGLLIGTYAHDK